MVELVGDICEPSFLTVPVMTTTERDALSNKEGLMIFNTTTNKLNFNTGAGWEAVTSA